MIVRISLGILIGAGIGALLGYFGKCSSGTCPLTANPYRGALYGAVMGAVFAFALPQKSQTQAEKTSPRESAKATVGSAKGGLVDIRSTDDFRTHVLDAGGICLVDLFSNRCPPCRALAPTVSSLARKYAGKVTVCKVDVDRLPTIAGEYRVSAIPTVLIIRDGTLVDRLMGLHAEAKYVAVLDKLLKGHKR